MGSGGSFKMRKFILCTVWLSKRLRWAGHVARIEEDRSTINILTGTPTGKRPFGRPRHRWEDNTEIYLREIGINTRNLVHCAQERDYWRALVNAYWTSGFHKSWSQLHKRDLGISIRRAWDNNVSRENQNIYTEYKRRVSYAISRSRCWPLCQCDKLHFVPNQRKISGWKLRHIVANQLQGCLINTYTDIRKSLVSEACNGIC